MKEICWNDTFYFPSLKYHKKQNTQSYAKMARIVNGFNDKKSFFSLPDIFFFQKKAKSRLILI